MADSSKARLKLNIVTLSASEWQEYKKIRLQALQKDPCAFGSTYEKESDYTDERWKQRLREASGGKSCIFFAEVNKQLVGMIIGGRTDEDMKMHLAHIWGVYVEEALPGKGNREGAYE